METIIARTQEELEKVFHLRYQVYVEEEGKFGKVEFSDKRMCDEFDDKTNTFNLLMQIKGEAIGTVRFTSTENELERLPSDKLYDFSTVRKAHKDLKTISVGMLAVRKSYQNSQTFTALMFSLLIRTNCDYYIFTLNHECSRLMQRVFKAKMLHEKFWSDEVGNFIVPMLVYKDQVLSFIKHQNSRNDFQKNYLIPA